MRTIPHNYHSLINKLSFSSSSSFPHFHTGGVKMKNDLVRRNYTFDIESQENEKGGHIITGRPIVFNSRTNLGDFDEIIDSGALDNTDLKDVRFLVNHDMSKIPLARSRNNNVNSTMQLMVDEDGMRIRVNLDTENNNEARALYSAVQRGDITGMSFCFSIDGEDWEGNSQHPLRHIKKIGSVVEVSAVSFPAYSATSIDARSLEALENARKILENIEEKAASLENEEKKEEEGHPSSETQEQASDAARALAIAEEERRAKDELELFKFKYKFFNGGI